MAFEFFFGLFGLISGDSRLRHKSRLDGDWRLFTPLGANLFREASGKKSPPVSPASFIDSSASSGGGGGGGDGSRKPIFSTSGTLMNANISVGENVFSSESASSASSVASTTGSSATLVGKPGSLELLSGKKYEFMEKAEGGGGGQDDELGASAAAQAAAEGAEEAQAGAQAKQPRTWRALYCRLVCAGLWLNVLRLLAGLVVEKSLITLDFYHLGAFRIHFLIPALCLAIQAAAVSLLFIRNNDETNWLVPFYSSKDYLIRSRSNFRPKMEDYTRRVNISVGLALGLAFMSCVALPAYLAHSAMVPASELMAVKTPSPGGGSHQTTAASPPPASILQTGSGLERGALIVSLLFDALWALYATYTCFLVAFYFNLICSIMKARFQSISKIIEELAESNTSKTTNQARKITTLYLEHNEACELLDESNDFWQYLIFFTYFTYIPAYCYCLYNLFFVDFDAWPSFITWVIHNHTGFIILLISFSAAGVSTEAHAPYTSLHTLSLIQLPLDVEVNIATFLHRVRGLTIGYSCYDLFAITNASMSNTAAACASYFLIVADFSRSSVFTLAQMNGTQAAAGAVAGPAAATNAGLSTPASA